MTHFLINLKPHAFNLQRIFLPDSAYQEWSGKYVCAELTNGSQYLCRLFHRPNLQRNCCLFDGSVEYIVKESDQRSGKTKLMNLQLIETTYHIKLMTIVVILTDVKSRQKWVTHKTQFVDQLKKLLSLFVCSNNSVVHLKELDAATKLGVHSVFVESIGKIQSGKIMPTTVVSVKDVVSVERWTQSKFRSPRVPGGDRAFNELKQYIECRRLQTISGYAKRFKMPQLLLVGSPGSGKKTIVKCAAHSCHALLLTVDSSQINKSELGESESALKEIFNRALLHCQEGPVVVLFLRLESICRRSGRILSQFNSLLDSVAFEHSLVIVATSSNPQELHESIKTSSRFQHVIFVGTPDLAERSETFKMIAGAPLLSDPMYDELASVTPGFVIADIALVVSRSDRDLHKVASPSEEERFKSLLKNACRTEPTALRGELGIVRSDASSIQIGGLASAKQTLLQLVQWPILHSDAFKRLNMKHTNGILLYGPPGCAKTSLVRNIANANNITFLCVSAADIYSPYVGDAEQTIAFLFHRARAAAPTILFIDEIDALVGCRDGRQKGVQDRVLSTFLIEIDGIGQKAEIELVDRQDAHVVVVAATNRPHVLDSALLRPGRLDRLMYIPPPDEKDRLDILKVITEKMPLHSDVNLEEIASRTRNYSGADLANLAREAAMQSMTSKGVEVNLIEHIHWKCALREIPPSLSEDQIQWYNDFKFG